MQGSRRPCLALLRLVCQPLGCYLYQFCTRTSPSADPEGVGPPRAACWTVAATNAHNMKLGEMVHFQLAGDLQVEPEG